MASQKDSKTKHKKTAGAKQKPARPDSGDDDDDYHHHLRSVG